MQQLSCGGTWMIAACVAAIVIVIGCGQKPGGETGTVSGTVTYQGEPAPPGAHVVFLHRESGQTAWGILAPDGTFDLSMQGSPHVPVGEYFVGVTPPLHPDAWKMSAKEYRELYMDIGEGRAERTVFEEIPEKYHSPETSGETFTVKTGPNEYTLDMQE